VSDAIDYKHEHAASSADEKDAGVTSDQPMPTVEYEIRIVRAGAAGGGEDDHASDGSGRLFARGTGVSIGVLDATPDTSLADLREMIKLELDDVPAEFEFIRSGLTAIGQRQEKHRDVRYVAEDGIVTIRVPA